MNLTKYIAIILAVLVGFVHGFGFADFVNDLHSDLAPLLTLLGEKVTMQYISQATGPLDCIVLALAPLGIITIMVSAIRVGGPTILKAIVGRAKENMAAAELELMSSTSREVCELFNGQNIVRCLGSGSVWQYICLFRKGIGNGQVRFMTLQQATNEGLLIERHGKTAKEPRGNAPSSQGSNGEGEVTGTTTGFASREQTTLQRMRRRFWKPVSKETDEETGVELGTIRPAQEPANEMDEDPTEQDIASPATIIVIYDAVPEAPNISLNLLHLGSRTRIWLAVMVGVVSQTLVLVFFGLISFNPAVQTFFKIDKPLSPYGFGMTFSGSLLMAIGVFLCADVVERSTVEEVYETNDQYGMRLYWLQQDQTVNDQVFQSFATFTDPYCTQFLKSRRAKDDRTPKKLQTETCVGVGFGLVGFVTQFVGFRGLHPAAPLAQLVAILGMTVFRAYARPGYTRNFQTAKLLHGFEQDWFAQQLAQYPTSQQILQELAQREAQRPVQEPTTQQLVQEPVQELTTQQLVQKLARSMDDGKQQQRGLTPWMIVTGREADYRAFEPLDSEAQSRAPNSEVQCLLVMRKDIYKLTKSRAISYKCAAKLATAMEKALGVLFPNGPSEGTLGFRWMIDVAVKGETEPVWIDLSYHQAAACWKVKAADLNAVLSLWVYTVCVQKNEPRSDDEHGEAEDCAWICRGLSEPSLKALGCRNHGLRFQVMQHLEVWSIRSRYHLTEIMEIWKAEVEEQQKEEEQQEESTPRLEVNCARAVCKFADSQDSMVGLYASDLLFSFMWSMAKSVQVPVGGEAKREQTASANGPPETKPLGNTAITGLISAFREASHWPEHETCLGVISPLSVLGKLPAQPWYHTISEAIMEGCKLKQRDLIRVAMRQGIQKAESLVLTYKAETTGLHERGLLWLLEHQRRTAEVPWAFRSDTMFDETPMGYAFQKCTSYLEGLLSGSDALSEHLDKLWANQGRLLQPCQITTHKKLPACFNFTALHEEAVRGNEIGGDAPPELKALVNVQDVCGWTPLFYAASAKNRKMVKQLLALGADATLADIHGYTAVHHACLSGCKKTLNILAEHGVKLDSQAINGALPIHLAAGRGHDGVIAQLYKLEPYRDRAKSRDPILDFDNRTPMHWAAAGGHIQAVEALKDDVNTQDDCGWSPLHVAILSGRGHLISTLCQLSADVESRDFKGRTPLILACAKGRWRIMGNLIESGARVHEADLDDMTPLHYLASNVDDAALISTLTKGLDNKAIQNLTKLRNRDGRTPLHFAAMRGGLDMINKLLELGATADLTDRQRKSPLFHALSCAKDEKVALKIAKVLATRGIWLRVSAWNCDPASPGYGLLA
ncbi:hypothetical protein CEP54_013441 [Fusarium duplospermum]|uniref:Uncharacterized protein n=1 Tax=Fusarium duplospermum TaxID=1325734 RepID=A0A428P2S1_9HYPO|nr:hypothetical protein CEP54_013441 [Fusarium duplospermum]